MPALGVLSEKPPPRRLIIIRPLFYIFVIIYLAGAIVGGIGLGWIALHPYNPVTPSEERNARTAALESNVEFRDIEIAASNGAFLLAWFMRPAEPNGDAVILLHGVGDNRLGTYGYGKWLVQHHYMVLMPDARAWQQWRRVGNIRPERE